MYFKIAVIGGGDTVVGFKALGLEAFPVSSPGEAEQMLRTLAKSAEYAIIYLEEDLASELSDEIAKYKNCVTPAIILIPGRNGSLGIGKAALHDAVMRAIGTDV